MKTLTPEKIKEDLLKLERAKVDFEVVSASCPTGCPSFYLDNVIYIDFEKLETDEAVMRVAVNEFASHIAWSKEREYFDPMVNDYRDIFNAKAKLFGFYTNRISEETKKITEKIGEIQAEKARLQEEQDKLYMQLIESTKRNGEFEGILSEMEKANQKGEKSE